MQYILSATPLFAVLAGITMTSFYGYLLFHSLSEVFSVVIACTIFMVVWNARRMLQNHYLLFVGIAYLYVGVVDFLHTLAFKGMGVFQGYGADLATQLWVAGRYVEALSLLLAMFFLHRKLHAGQTFLIYGVSAAILLASIFYWQIFPTCFVEGSGLTPFKIYSEYIVCLILLAVVGVLIKHSRDFDRKVLALLVASIATAIIQELAFTTYLSVYGFSNMIGHLLKIVSFYLLYKAIIETSLAAPYKLLFRDLKQSEAKFRSLFDTNVVPIAYCHIDGRVMDANDDYLKLLGYTRKDLTQGKVRWDEATPPEWKHVDEKGLDYLKRDGVAPPLEKEYIRKDGTRVPVLLGATRLPGDSGQVVAFAVDLTERKRAEEALQKAHTELQDHALRLQETNSELERFAYTISHDLRAPLRAINGFARMLATECGQTLGEEGQRRLAVIEGNAIKMGMLIDDLLAFSRAGRTALNTSGIDMNSLMAEVVETLNGSHAGPHPAIHVSALPAAQGDRTLVRQVLANLLENAMKFSRNKPQPEIEVGSFEKDGKQVYYVKDNGVGFDMKFYGKLFGVFQRLVPEREFEGTGVGLAIVQRLVNRHGGHAWAEARPGEGATFFFTLRWKDRERA